MDNERNRCEHQTLSDRSVQTKTEGDHAGIGIRPGGNNEAGSGVGETEDYPGQPVIEFDPKVKPSKNMVARDSGGYGVFLFDPEFEVPQDQLLEPKDIAESFFEWTEKHYPLKQYWETVEKLALQQGVEPMPYQRWKGFARQMIVLLVQKHLADKELNQRPEIGGTD